MKKILLSLSILTSLVSFAQTTKYDGNGKNGFGGAVGQGFFEITDKGDSVSFLLNKGAATFDSLLVFYIDGIDGGITSTANLSAGTDMYSTAVTGKYSETQKSILNFSSGFQPDFSVVFNKDGGRIFFFEKDLQGNDIIMAGANVALAPAGTNTAATYTGTIAKADVSVAGPVSFKLIGTYISSKAFRSNEGFGDVFEAFDNANGYAAYSTANFLTFSSASALSVNLTDLKALNVNGKVQLKWTVAQETNIDGYQVQRSTNGIHFSTIATVQARNVSTYTYTADDNAPAYGVNYYRLLIKEKGGLEISKVVSIKNGIDKSKFTVQQRGSILNLRLNNVAAGTYKISVVNSNGQLLQAETLQYNGIDASKEISLKSNATKGIYRISIQSEKLSLFQSVMLQ